MKAFAEAVRSLGPGGRVQAGAAAAFRSAAAGNRTGRGSSWPDPGDLLGPFDALPEEIRDAIRQEIAADDRWRMKGYAMGKWHTKAARLLWSVSRRPGAGPLSRLAEILAVSVQSGPARVIYGLRRRQLLWQAWHSRRPEIPALLRAAGIEARDLAICYARDIPQHPQYRGFWHSGSQNITYGTVIGLDLLLTERGCWYVEANLNFGMSNTRVELYERDPFIENLASFAAEKGYRTLVFVNNLSSGMNRTMAAQLDAEALRLGLKVRIIEDACIPGSGYQQSFEVPQARERDTLVVRTRGYRTVLDYIIDNKRASQKALEFYKKAAQEPALLLPESGQEPVLGDIAEDEPFPNLVYKYPERDAGKGIVFLKAASAEHAKEIIYGTSGLCSPKKFTDLLYSFVDDKNGIYQSYIHSPMNSDRRLSKIRSHVLLSPGGCRFLSAHRVVSRFPVPRCLPPGLVKDDRPFLVNLSRSSAYELLTPAEEEAVSQASLAIARGLSWAVSQGFETGEDEEEAATEKQGEERES